MRATRIVAGLGVILRRVGLCVVVSQAIGLGGQARADSQPTASEPVALGYEIFHREWLPGDPRSHGGDGLGPVYNDTSCVACHNSGGSGGAGPVNKNIDILSATDATLDRAFTGRLIHSSPSRSAPVAPAPAVALEPLLAIHAGFKGGTTVVLHRFGIDPGYAAWRSRALHPDPSPAPPESVFVQAATAEMSVALAISAKGMGHSETQIAQIRQELIERTPAAGRAPRSAGGFSVTRSQRNPTALFGLGLIDAIPDATLEAAAARQAKESPEIAGRVSRLKDGRLGRLGWKGQTANVEDFVLNACAVEVGLEVPGHPQGLLPQAPRYQPPGLDLTAEECAALVAYVRSLPKPLERTPARVNQATVLNLGKETFAAIGCTGCHAPRLGDVEGIYSDLLLHSMDPEMAESGSYGVRSADPGDERLVPVFARGSDPSIPPPVGQGGPPAIGAARRQEWRTPPLWGFRDSGPYMHDGRAQTLDEAVALHGGQGGASAIRFFALTQGQRLQVEAFLKSLIAPD